MSSIPIGKKSYGKHFPLNILRFIVLMKTKRYSERFRRCFSQLLTLRVPQLFICEFRDKTSKVARAAFALVVEESAGLGHFDFFSVVFFFSVYILFFSIRPSRFGWMSCGCCGRERGGGGGLRGM